MYKRYKAATAPCLFLWKCIYLVSKHTHRLHVTSASNLPAGLVKTHPSSTGQSDKSELGEVGFVLSSKEVGGSSLPAPESQCNMEPASLKQVLGLYLFGTCQVSRSHAGVCACGSQHEKDYKTHNSLFVARKVILVVLRVKTVSQAVRAKILGHKYKVYGNNYH